MPTLSSPPPFVPAKVEDPKCLNFPYPQDAKELNITGITTMSVLIDDAGKVVAARVVQSSGSGYLDNATKDGIKKCTFIHPPGYSWTVFYYFWELGAKPSRFLAFPEPGKIEPPV